MSSQLLRSMAALFIFSASTVLAADPSRSATTPKKKAASARISSSVDVQPAAPLSDQEFREVSFTAGRILTHIARARDAIRDKKSDDAAMQVEQSLKLTAIIDNVLPHYKVKTEIKSGDLAYSDEDDVTLRYVTLFDELEHRDIISPIVQAKKEAQQKQEQKEEPDAATKKGRGAIAISHADISHTTAKLDIVLARHMLNRAKQALDDGKTEEADESLHAVQNRGVLLEYEEIDLPLEEAADNLKLAEMEMQEGRHAEAKAALEVAIDQLKEYEELAGENRGAEVKSLHEEITKLTTELEKGKVSDADQQKHTAKISEWWNRATKWFKGATK